VYVGFASVEMTLDSFKRVLFFHFLSIKNFYEQVFHYVGLNTETHASTANANSVTRLVEISPFGLYFWALGAFFLSDKYRPIILAQLQNVKNHTQFTSIGSRL
jgi:hypothetical protein